MEKGVKKRDSVRVEQRGESEQRVWSTKSKERKKEKITYKER